jgi:hypothetical protein
VASEHAEAARTSAERKRAEELEDALAKVRLTTGRAFVKPALQALEDGAGEHALRLVAADALLANDFDFKLVPQLWGAAAQAIFANRTRALLKGSPVAAEPSWVGKNIRANPPSRKSQPTTVTTTGEPPLTRRRPAAILLNLLPRDAEEQCRAKPATP